MVDGAGCGRRSALGQNGVALDQRLRRPDLLVLAAASDKKTAFFEKRGKKVLTREGGSGSITGRREERRDAERVKEKREKNLKKVLDKRVRM